MCVCGAMGKIQIGIFFFGWWTLKEPEPLPQKKLKHWTEAMGHRHSPLGNLCTAPDRPELQDKYITQIGLNMSPTSCRKKKSILQTPLFLIMFHILSTPQARNSFWKRPHKSLNTALVRASCRHCWVTQRRKSPWAGLLSTFCFLAPRPRLWTFIKAVSFGLVLCCDIDSDQCPEMGALRGVHPCDSPDSVDISAMNLDE